MWRLLMCGHIKVNPTTHFVRGYSNRYKRLCVDANPVVDIFVSCTYFAPRFVSPESSTVYISSWLCGDFEVVVEFNFDNTNGFAICPNCLFFIV